MYPCQFSITHSPKNPIFLPSAENYEGCNVSLTDLADSSVAEGDFPIAPNPTPTASPSAIEVNNHKVFREMEGCHSVSFKQFTVLLWIG